MLAPLVMPIHPTVKEDAKLQEILSTPEVQSALLDKEIQELILTLKSNPDEAQRYGIWMWFCVQFSSFSHFSSLHGRVV